ncbi:MAG: ThiF family adenylyltransferase [Deltaproteobacteria bacterium]|nr:ThiF family adenylyltransferase [Deltaproteobacteria bacterium]
MADLARDGLERYSRQSLFWGIGDAGQGRLRESRVVVIGCGALGCANVALLARGGVGRLRLVDRDFVELSNLQRQVLFEESDAREGLPKAIAAAAAVGRINSEVEVEPVVADVSPDNVEGLISGADVVLDGTDNFETRYLLNDACVKREIPWIYGGAVGSTGMSLTILPGKTPCFRCISPEAPPPGSAQTCDTTGVLASVITSVAAVQWTEAVKLLVGAREHLSRSLLSFDLWASKWQSVDGLVRNPECPCCGRGSFEYLEARATSRTTSLCGRNAVQVSLGTAQRLDLAGLAERLRAAGEVTENPFLVRFAVGPHELTIFPDGRAIVKGTNDEALARSLYARYVGA